MKELLIIGGTVSLRKQCSVLAEDGAAVQQWFASKRLDKSCLWFYSFKKSNKK